MCDRDLLAEEGDRSYEVKRRVTNETNGLIEWKLYQLKMKIAKGMLILTPGKDTLAMDEEAHDQLLFIPFNNIDHVSEKLSTRIVVHIRNSPDEEWMVGSKSKQVQVIEMITKYTKAYQSDPFCFSSSPSLAAVPGRAIFSNPLSCDTQLSYDQKDAEFSLVPPPQEQEKNTVHHDQPMDREMSLRQLHQRCELLKAELESLNISKLSFSPNTSKCSTSFSATYSGPTFLPKSSTCDSSGPLTRKELSKPAPFTSGQTALAPKPQSRLADKPSQSKENQHHAQNTTLSSCPVVLRKKRRSSASAKSTSKRSLNVNVTTRHRRRHEVGAKHTQSSDKVSKPAKKRKDPVPIFPKKKIPQTLHTAETCEAKNRVATSDRCPALESPMAVKIIKKPKVSQPSSIMPNVRSSKESGLLLECKERKRLESLLSIERENHRKALERIEVLEEARREDAQEIARLEKFNAQETTDQLKILSRLEAILAVSKEEKVRLTSRITDLSESLNSKIEACRRMREENETLEQQMVVLRQDQHESRNRLKEYREEIQRLRSENEIAKQKVSLSGKEQFRLSRENQNLMKEMQHEKRLYYS